VPDRKPAGERRRHESGEVARHPAPDGNHVGAAIDGHFSERIPQATRLGQAL
jgi:hypothetical protein